MTSFSFAQKALNLGVSNVISNKNLAIETTLGWDFFVLYVNNLRLLK